MSTITVKNIPQKLHETLKRRALLAHRSLNGEIIACLETVVGITPLDVNQMAFDAGLIRNSLKGEALPQDIDKYKKEGRA